MADDNIHDEAETGGEGKTKFLFIFRRAPHGTIYPYEGLEVILIMAAYEQDITAAFVDDGVYCLKKGQNTTGLGIKEFAKTFKVLEPYGVEHLYVDRASLEDRGLTEDDLVTGVEVVESEEIANVISAQKVILPF